MKLFVIGNGFDIGHELKTSYKDFKKYLEKHSVKWSQIFNSFYKESSEENFWSSFEESLGNVGNECCLGKSLGGFEQIFADSNNVLFNELNNYMQEWIEFAENYGNKVAKEYFKSMFSGNDCRYLSFNYTNTLQELYGVESKFVYYIHNSINDIRADKQLGGLLNNKLIVGHRPIEYSKYKKGIASFLKASEKDIVSINDTFKNSMIFDFKFDDIYVFGCSYNEIDRLYFETLYENNKNTRWHLFCYSSDDKESAKNRYAFIKNADISFLDIKTLK